jgi:hypothetical protein
METINLSASIVESILKVHPHGINFSDRIVIRDPERNAQNFELMILPKTYVRQHPWENEIKNSVSWLTEAIADIIARKIGSEPLQSAELIFAKEESAEAIRTIGYVKDYCRSYFGIDFNFRHDNNNSVWTWKYDDGLGEWLYIYLLKIDINYALVTEHFSD